ncbi:RNA helicase Mov10l1 [Ahaetulla prasina]|uniref:RNA helicase Mov10l1 n=1 Tax=Ahaetulla prasina TaxID=499056 RepID=UPI00264960FA|nr:RNA helicase Mov10l1 [Ahaetulla prasina]
MLQLLAKGFSFFWRNAEQEVEEESQSARDDKKIKIVEGVVTRFCPEYGMIDDLICFTKDAVMRSMPLQVGQRVIAHIEEDKISHGLRAVRVEAICDKWDDNSVSSYTLDATVKTLIGSITKFTGVSGYINQTTSFSMEVVCKDFYPCKGDLVQAEYIVNTTTWTSEAVSVKPLRFKRIDKVHISSMYGRTGVVDNSVFFSLDFLSLPKDYVPHKHDLVNVVVVESNQSCYSWRAFCMAPADKNRSLLSQDIILNEPNEDLLKDKEGLEVSKMTDFGKLKLGVSENMEIWIENKGETEHSLISCKLCGWDKEKQFRLQLPEKNQVCWKTASALSVPDGAISGGFTYLSNIGDYNNSTIEQSGSLICEKQKYEGEETTGHNRSISISSGSKTSITVVCTAKNPGRCKELLLLCFSDCIIGRYLEATIVTEEESLIEATQKYSQRQYQVSSEAQMEKATVVLPQLKRKTRRQLPNFLPQYNIPDRVRECVEKKYDILIFYPELGEGLTLLNYKTNFSILLWLEEIHAEQELKEFAMYGVTLKKNGNFLVLAVPGVIEGRPSLFLGDKVILKTQDYLEEAIHYAAYITDIDDEDVTLKVNSDFEQAYNFEPMNVEFVHSRITTRRCHHAVEQAINLGAKVLFPEAVIVQSPQIIKQQQLESEYSSSIPKQSVTQETKEERIKKEEGTPKNEKAAVASDMVTTATQRINRILTWNRQDCDFFNPLLNEHQKSAVKRILSGECRPTPYILFGPPGTGKTVTIIEAILQIYYSLPSSRILVCAPSNSATDLICVRLHDSKLLKPGVMVRVNAINRNEENLNEVVKCYCKAGEDLHEASRFRIIIVTCSSAGMFYQIGVRFGHFTHVFVDEAGQANEPESLIPLGLISEVTGQIILSGDPMQLGPIIKSMVAMLYGLNISLLARLMHRPLYLRDEDTFGPCGSYNPLLITKLVKNYRSHGALLTLPSKLFYHQELEVCADPSVVNSLLGWDKLPKKGFPLIFHGMRGMEMREGCNPSWFNPTEAVQVMRYCCLLVKGISCSVSGKDIGVIAPYRKQVEKITVLLRSVDLPDIKVGSVEEFQGQEFSVIIISTVRSNETSFTDERTFLGFLANSKRFNVAITRAKALLIVVGNPHVLAKDPCFNALLEYSLINDAYVGCDLPQEFENQKKCS